MTHPHRPAAVTFALLFAALLAPMARVAVADEAQHGMDVRIVDRITKKPIPGATLKVRLCGRTFDQKPEAAGDWRIPLRVPDPADFGVTASAPGYTPRWILWRGFRLGQAAPTSHTFELAKGVPIGGIVNDSDGKPIAGVNLSVSAYDARFGQAGVEHDFLSDQRVVTDAEGRWRCEETPAELGNVMIAFLRPQSYAYTTTELGTQNGLIRPDPNRPKPEQLRDMSAVLVRHALTRVMVKVVGPDDKPIAGADVRNDGQSDAIKTDAAGQIECDVLAAGPVFVSAQAPGFAPAVFSRLASLGDKPDPIVLKLTPGKSLRGRIVDMGGKPIAGANVSVAGDTRTDADGRFTLNDLPPGDANLWIGAEGFLQSGNLQLATGDKEHVIKLRRPLRVSGTVVDADTGKPIEAFTVVPASQVAAGQPIYLSRSLSGAFTGGKFSGNVHEEWAGRQLDKRFIRVEADGYVPATSSPIDAKQETFKADFKLKRGEGPAGVVLGVDRAPMAGVKVYVSTLMESVFVSDGTVAEAAYPFVTTDAEGRFKLPAQDGPFAAVVVHESGFIMKTQDELKRNAQLRIMPWGRIEGVVKVAGKPAAGHTIRINYRNVVLPDEATVSFGNTPATTDAEGHYAIEKVGPVQAKVGRELPPDPTGLSRRQPPTHEQPVDVKPGESLTVNIGGTGVPLVARVKLPAEFAGRAKSINLADFTEVRLALPPLPVPDDFATKTLEQKVDWLRTYMESPDGKKLDRNNFKRSRFPVRITPDGSITVDDLTPGTYSLRVRAIDTSKGNPNNFGEEVAKGETYFVIPENYAGKQFDAGEVELKSLFNLQVGQPIPDPPLKTLDGKPFKLSDYRGKVVLLDFWATWCGPCVLDTPNLKAVHEAFGKDDRFVLVSLSLDPEAQAPIDYVKKNDLAWQHGLLGDWGKTKVPEQFGVRGIPSYFLIGPDGKLLKKDLHGSTMKADTAAALEALPPTK